MSWYYKDLHNILNLSLGLQSLKYLLCGPLEKKFTKYSLVIVRPQNTQNTHTVPSTLLRVIFSVIQGPQTLWVDDGVTPTSQMRKRNSRGAECPAQVHTFRNDRSSTLNQLACLEGPYTHIRNPTLLTPGTDFDPYGFCRSPDFFCPPPSKLLHVPFAFNIDLNHAYLSA